MSRRRANKLSKQGELARAQEADPEAKRQVKRDGITVGKRVRYLLNGAERWGVVKELRRALIRGKYIESAVIQLSGEGMMKGGEDIVVREDEVYLGDIQEILGDGRLAQPTPKPRRVLPTAPPREEGYETCDIGSCETPPSIALVLRKFDRKLMDFGPAHIVAMCKGHYEPYKRNADEPVIPMHWKMGVEWDKFSIPDKPAVEDEETVED